MTGTITWDRKARLALRLVGHSGQAEQVVATIDTGFTGSLTLPTALIQTLACPYQGTRRVMLADGSHVELKVYEATVLWDGRPRTVLALATGGVILAGMSLLYGSLMTMEIVDGGAVTITPLP
jgi:clan AA aspartic protease